MASTYPLEIVEAARWSKAHPDVKGDAVAGAVQKQTWDPSVKSLCAFPTVLEKMNEKIDWTQKLGDAFLAQQKEVMQAVQILRNKAKETGNLKSTKEVTVKEEPAPAGVTRAADHHHRVAGSGSGLRADVQPHRGIRRLGLSLLPALCLLPAGLLRRRDVLVVHRRRDRRRRHLGQLQLGRQRRRHRHQPPEQFQPQRDQRQPQQQQQQSHGRSRGQHSASNRAGQQQAELAAQLRTSQGRRLQGFGHAAEIRQGREPAGHAGARTISRPCRTGPPADVARRRWAISATWRATASARATWAAHRRAI